MNCPICRCRARKVFPAKYVSAAVCRNSDCRHIWAVDALANAGVQTKIHHEAEMEHFRLRNEELATLLRKKGVLKAKGKLLDLGSGLGHILIALRSATKTADFVAVEPDASGLDRLRAQGFRAYSSIEDVPEHDFDAVTMIEVIEHVLDPIGFLKQLRNRMIDGGIVFVTTPAGETRYGRRDTNAYDTPEHVQFFTERSLALAFRTAGFTRFRLETINEMTGALTPGIKGKLKNLLRPIRAMIFGHRHLTGFAVKGPLQSSN